MAAGLVRLPVAGHDILVYSNADHDGHERVGMTVWLSLDGGATWLVKRLVDGGPSAYSSLSAGRPGTASEGWVYLQYEERDAAGRIAQFNLSWILRGEATGDGEVPTGLG
jgi:sialidase-1